MKVSLGWILSTVTLTAVLAVSASAQKPGPIASVGKDSARNNCWPDPFVCPDRAAVRAPFVLMVQNGWRRQNLLAEHHFVDGQTELNEAGRIKVRWIVTEAPLQHRTIYVRRGDSLEVTAGRVASVQQWTSQVAPGQFAMIEETSISAVGWPGERVDALERKFQSSTPDPKLPEAQSGGEAN